MEAAAAFAAGLDELAALAEELRADMRRQWKQFFRIDGSFLRPIIGFVSSVDWSEPWLLALIIFHIYLLVVSIKSRKDNNMQTRIFFFGVFGVYFAERLNLLLARTWSHFARHPYFDQSGVFILIMWSVPLLLLSAVILGNTIRLLTSHFMKWRKAQLETLGYMAQVEKSNKDL